MNQPYPPQQPGWGGQQAPGYGQPPSPPAGQPYPQQQPPPQPAQAPPQPAQPPPGYGQNAQPPPGHGQPGQPPQAAAQSGGQSGIVLTLRYFPLAFVFALLTPVVLINGQRVQARWGRNEIPMPPGQYQLHVHVPYLIPQRIGTVDTVVPVSSGQIVDAEYRAPVWAFSAGSLGPPPQQYNGVGAMIGVCAAIFVVGFLLAVLPALA